MKKVTKKLITGLATASLILTTCGVCQTPLTASAAGAPSVTKSLTVTAGKKKKIKVKGRYIKSTAFKSSSTKVAAVSKKGVVRGKKAGKCKVTVTVKYRKKKKAKKILTKKMSCKVIVKKAKATPKETDAPDEPLTPVPTQEPTEPTAAPAQNPTDSAELTAAKELGILSASQESRIDQTATQTDVVEMVSAAVQKHYGKTGKFLADRENGAGPDAATRHYLASTLYFAMYEQIKSPEYSGYEDYMSMANGNPVMADAEVYVYGIRKDGTTGVLNLYDDCADIGNVRGNDEIAAKYRFMEDYGADSAMVYVCALYDRVTGVPVMALDSENKFNPQDKITVGDAARTTLRLYRSLEGEEKYVTLSEAGTYNHKIITNDLLNRESTLPDASNQKLPVWRGILNCTMGFVQYQALGGRADKVIREGDIKAAADTGFNHMTVMISFSRLQGHQSKDGYVDGTRLEELDRVIALCMKYDMHVTLANVELPGISEWDESGRDNVTEKLSAPGMAETYAGYWGMLAERYKGIDNKFLAFNLMVEPEFTSEEQYEKLLGPSVKAIFAADESRVVIADIHSWGLTGEAMAEMGVALSYHHYEPRKFCALGETGNEWDKDYLQSVKWELEAKDTFDLHSDGDENIASLNDVRKIADQYGVGFMAGEFGIFGSGSLSKYRYTDETMNAYITSMTKALEDEGIGWVWGSMDGQWGIMATYPCVEGASYVKLENSTNYYDETLGAIFKKVNGVPDAVPDETAAPYDPVPTPVIASYTKPEDYSTVPVPFKEEIDPFHKQVKEFPVPDEYKGGYNAYTGSGYIYRKLEIDGIHLYEIRRNDGKPKPLVIQIHGGFWHKDPESVEAWAEKGLCAVTIDVSGHGESQDGPLQAPAMWMETVRDIDVLIEYYNTIPDVDAENFGLIGQSMGGNISEYYTVYGKYKPTAICLENASADATNEGSARGCGGPCGNTPPPIWKEDELWKFTTATAPINYPEYFKDIWVFIAVGALEDEHSPEKMEAFKNKIEALGSDKVVFHRFEGVGHETPPSWEENERNDFFTKLLLNKD